MVALNRKRAAVLVVGLLGLNCRDSSGPGLAGHLAFAPTFESSSAGIVAFDRLRITLMQAPPSSTTVLDTIVAISPTDDSVDLTLSVPLSSPREDLLLYLRLVNAAGDTVFRNTPYPQAVTITSGGVPAVVQAPIAYVGVGFDAVAVAIASPDTSVLFGDTIQLDAAAFGSQAEIIPGTPIAWRSLDSTRVRVPDAATGKVVGALQRGPARIVAELLTGPADTVLVAAQPVPNQLVIRGGSGQSGGAGLPLALPLEVEVRAADNLPVSGVSVRFRALSGGLPADTTVVSDGLGRASVLPVLGLNPGQQIFQASLPAHSGVSVATFTLTAVATGPARLAFAAGPSGTTAGTVFAPAIQVEVQDGSGNPVPTDTISITLTLGSNPAGATLSGPTTVTTSAGIATFSGISLDRAASGYTLLATASGLTSATSAAFAVTPASPQQLVITSTPAAAFAGATFPSAVVVEARDAFGNRTPAFAGQVTVAIDTNPGSGTLSGATTAQAVNGIATFDALTIDNPATGYTLVATSSGLADGTGGRIDILPPQAGRFWVTSANGNWSNPANWSGGVVPGSADTVFITIGGTYTVTVDVNDTVAFLNVGGGSGVQTLSVTSRTFGIDSGATFGPTAVFNLINSTLNGASGTLVNQGAVTAQSSALNPAFVNAGFTTIRGNVNFSDVSTTPGSTFLIEGDAFFSTATATVLNDFLNLGTIDLTAINASGTTAQLNVTNGTLLNAVGATINVLPGTGGARIIGAELDNQGALSISHPLSLTKSSASHHNSGAIDLAGANFSIGQSGTAPSFATSGSIAIGTGDTLTVTAGSFDFDGGTLNGTGHVVWSSTTANLTPDLSSATLNFSVTNATVNGPGSFTNSAGRTTVITGGTFNSPLINEGLLTVRSFAAVNGPFTTANGSTLRVEGDAFFSSAVATMASGFTNNGTIELIAINGSGTTSQLNVTTGPLVNAIGGAINVLAGNGGTRVFGAELHNQGILTVGQTLSLSKASAAHQNSGTIDISGGDLTVSQSGTSPSFATSGSIAVGAGRTLAVTAGLFDFAGGTLGGTGTVSWNGGTLNLTPSLSNASLTLSLTSQIVNGPGSLMNAGGRTLTITGGLISAPLDNQGLLTMRGFATLNGAVTTTAASTLRVEGDAFFSSATTTVSNGFVNNGAIELDAINGGGTTALLNVTNGTLVNATGATISSLVGNGGARTLGAQLDNQGTIIVSQPLTLTKTSAAHQNSGTIDVTGADLTLTQSGASASFTTSGSGAINVAATRTFAVSGGMLNYAGGIIGGAGTVVWNGTTVNLTPDFDNAVTGLTLTNALVNGPGRLTNTAGRTLILTGGQLTGPVTNEGLFVVRGSAGLSGALTTTAGSTLRVEGDAFFSSATLTVQDGFTNLGTIELDAINGAGTTSQLNVTNGTLVNAPAAVIAALAGTGSTRHLNAQLDNQGSLVVSQTLTLSKTSATHLNSGIIDISGANLTLTLAGGGGSFTTSGTVTVGTGRTLDVSGGGTFAFAGGALNGSGSIVWNGGTVDLSQPLSNTSLSLTLSNTTVNGPGTLTNAAGRTLVITSGVMNAPLDNQGALTIRGGPAINGAFTTSPASLLRVEGDAFFSSAHATFLNGFTNNGTIELTSINGTGQPSQISVTNGTLLNALGATIDVQAGSGSTRNLNASFDNQGTLIVGQNLTFGRGSSVIMNSGTIDLTTGDLLISQFGTSPSFTNIGTVNVGAGRTWTVSGGAWTFDGGTLSGNALVLNTVNPAVFNKAHGLAGITLNGTIATFSTPQATDATQFILTNSTVNGPTTFTNAIGKSLVMTGGTLDLPFTNLGTLTLRGTTVVKGLLTTQPGSTLRVEGDASFSSAFATIEQGFVNNGTIELTAVNGAGTPAQLVVTTGSLVNATGATIDVAAGTGGSRALNAMLDNNGVIKVNQAVTVTRFNALHTNRGTIDVVGGDLTISQSGGNPGFINNAPGAIGIAAGRTMKITAGTVINQLGAKILGSGTLDVSAPATFSSLGELVPGTSAGTLTVLGSALLDPGSTLTIELGGPTEGAEYDQLRISGDALLAGVLNVTTINGFNPAGSSFIILRSGSNGGGTRFGIANVPPGCSQPVYTPTQVSFTCS